MNHGLSEKALDTVVAILKPYAERIDRVALYGSRATGAYRPNSDIDMVVHGALNEAEQDRLYTLFDESNLSVPVVSTSMIS